jgi:hydrogenase-1 operon protein HyaF
MRPVSIPIRSLTAEPAEPDDATLDYLPMPREMSTFEMPPLPEPSADHDIAGACELLTAFVTDTAAWLEGAGDAPVADLAGVPAGVLRVLNETLGEGEVAARIDAGSAVRVQETVFSGIWREQHLDADGHLLHDYLLAAPIPPLVLARATAVASPRLRERELPPGAMNVPALMHELQEAMDRSGPNTPAHAINLTLLPLSPQDVAHIDAVLDGGSVAILSRGFGNCRIGSTAARNVWRVQYFNQMNMLLLNTVEVTEMPEVAVAAREDLVESHERLASLVQWMGESIVAA